jgi:hypothetical protein
VLAASQAEITPPGAPDGRHRCHWGDDDPAPSQITGRHRVEHVRAQHRSAVQPQAARQTGVIDGDGHIVGIEYHADRGARR